MCYLGQCWTPISTTQDQVALAPRANCAYRLCVFASARHSLRCPPLWSGCVLTFRPDACLCSIDRSCPGLFTRRPPTPTQTTPQLPPPLMHHYPTLAHFALRLTPLCPHSDGTCLRCINSLCRRSDLTERCMLYKAYPSAHYVGPPSPVGRYWRPM